MTAVLTSTLLAVVLTASPMRADGSADARFRMAVSRTAKSAGLRAVTLWRGDLDGDPSTTEYAALLCPPESDSSLDSAEVYLVLAEATHGSAFQVTRNAGSLCQDAQPSTEFLPLHGAIEVSDVYASWDGSMKVAIRDARLVRLADTMNSHTFTRIIAQTRDWNALTFKGSIAPNDLATPVATSGDLILARPDGGADLRTGWTEVVHGKEQWTGAGDAQLQVSATLRGDAVELTLHTGDDVRLPVPANADDKAFLAADHIELWWAPDAPSKICPKAATCLRLHLGAGVRADGTWDVRWLEPVPLPVPEVKGTAEALTVRLARAQLSPADHANVPFTAVYSDSDAAGAGQQTLVATSTLRWGKSESFGRLVWLNGGARFPAVDEFGPGVDVQVAPWTPGGKLPEFE